MGIYTRFGSEIEIVCNTGDGWARVKYVSDGAMRHWHISEFTEDKHGEIDRAMANAPTNAHNRR